MNDLRSLVSARSLLRCWLALGATTLGAPNRDVELPTPLVDPGAVAVLYGQLFIDGFESSGFNGWSSVAP